MKVKLLEHYQDAQVHYLPEQEVDVDAALGAWLVEHRKAVKLEVMARAEGGVMKPTAVFVEPPVDFDPRKLADAIHEAVAAVDEPPTQPPAPQPKRSKRGKS
jgi:hypothetical protein